MSAAVAANVPLVGCCSNLSAGAQHAGARSGARAPPGSGASGLAPPSRSRGRGRGRRGRGEPAAEHMAEQPFHLAGGEAHARTAAGAWLLRSRKGYCATRGALPHRAPCPRCTAECMHRVGHRKGYCATTSGAGNCSTDAMGSWPIDKKRPLRDSLRAATEWCLAQCAGCARCRFVSVSARWSDCSWFERCSLDGLHRDVLSFRSGRAPSARTSLSSWPVL